MIVVAIIGILAAIAIPRFANLIQRSKEAATQGNLGALRSALAIHYGAEVGVWPTTLAAMTTSTPIYIDVIPNARVGQTWVPEDTNGELADPTLTTGPAADVNDTTAWCYNNSLGSVCVNCTLTASDGSTSISSW
ncbi:MAG: hypothetical protein GH154_04665 [Firmicutes bacterium]|nr:hypothetical protein [Bacillota bacterium]